MKKFAIMAALAVAAMSASAVEVGIRGTHTKDSSADSVGVTVGQKFGAVGVEGAFDRSTRGTLNTNKYSLVGSLDVAKFAGITVAPTVGVSFIDPSMGVNGYAASVGVGASYPLTKQVALVANYAYQKGQDRVKAFDGNQVSAGVKYSF
jgi:outer membrane autotransporter protein